MCGPGFFGEAAQRKRRTESGKRGFHRPPLFRKRQNPGNRMTESRGPSEEARAAGLPEGGKRDMNAA